MRRRGGPRRRQAAQAISGGQTTTWVDPSGAPRNKQERERRSGLRHSEAVPPSGPDRLQLGSSSTREDQGLHMARPAQAWSPASPVDVEAGPGSAGKSSDTDSVDFREPTALPTPRPEGGCFPLALLESLIKRCSRRPSQACQAHKKASPSNRQSRRDSESCPGEGHGQGRRLGLSRVFVCFWPRRDGGSHSCRQALAAAHSAALEAR